AEAPREQRLTGRIVDLVRAGVGQVLALEVHVPAPARGETRGVGERGGPADPGGELAGELGLEFRGMKMLAHAALQALERRDERLGHVTPAERAEAAARVGKFTVEQRCEQHFGVGQSGSHTGSSLRLVAAAARAAAVNCMILSGLFTPGRASTPLDTST